MPGTKQELSSTWPPSFRPYAYAALLFFGVPLVVTSLFQMSLFSFRRPSSSNFSEAVHHVRQIASALHEFEKEYGTLPGDPTSTRVKEKTGTTIPLGSKNSNDYFRQLIAAKFAQSEMHFYAKIPRCRKPDNQIDGAQALKKSECGFSYLIGATMQSPPDTPVVVTPLLPGKAAFDYKGAEKHFRGKAVILRKDGSVRALPIDKSGRVWINGKNIFDPTQPFWNGKAPTLKWPDL